MPASHPSLTFLRTFTTTPAFAARSSVSALKWRHRKIPPYPYGPNTTYKQSNFGLYGNASIQFGNKISERNEIKSRRSWKPNIQNKRLWSEALAKFVRVKVQARVLRTIDKEGGLDEYLLGEKAARIRELGMGGWALKWQLMGTKAVRERFERQREKMGLVAPARVEVIEEDGESVVRWMQERLSEVRPRKTDFYADILLHRKEAPAWIESEETPAKTSEELQKMRRKKAKKEEMKEARTRRMRLELMQIGAKIEKSREAKARRNVEAMPVKTEEQLERRWMRTALKKQKKERMDASKTSKVQAPRRSRV